MTASSPINILRQYWGHNTFRPLQEDIIAAVLAGKDTLALLPTGGGKSICYQVPALAKDGICIVVSPLIALIKDQVAGLQSKGIKATAVYSGLTKREVDIIFDNCVYGDYKFLYLSPERLTTDLAKARIEKMNVNLLAVDEAHCISQWGYDFRPAYLKIAEIKSLIPDIPILALTATATEIVKEDICDKLEFEKRQIFQGSFERKNIAYVVRYEDNKLNKTAAIFNKIKGTGIVYVRTRRKTREVAEYLKKNGIAADYYHGGLDMKLRSIKQDQWINNKLRVIVCTNAFGMGIDKPDVRSVVHIDIPDNIESYYQESGRAGRDGKKSFAVLLYNLSDRLEIEKRIKNNYPSVPEILNIYNALGNYLQLATGSGQGESYDFNIVEFSKTFQFEVVKVHNSLQLLEQQGLIVNSEAIFIPSRIKIRVNKEELYKFQVANKKYDRLIKLLLRTHIGLFDEYVTVNESYIAKIIDWEKGDVVNALEYMAKVDLLIYAKHSDQPKITFVEERKDPKNIGLDAAFIKERKQLYEQKLKAMLSYAGNKIICRSRFVLDYFGEKDNYRCGICDVCLEMNRLSLSEREYDAIISEIQGQIKLGHNHPNDLVKNIKQFNEQKVFKILKWLMDAGQVMQYEDNLLIWSE